MKTFDVTIIATVTKTIRVEAEDKAEAVGAGYRRFGVASDGTPEKYTDDAYRVVEVTA